jgi:hypothetical protein
MRFFLFVRKFSFLKNTMTIINRFGVKGGRKRERVNTRRVTLKEK